jgi:hypothetical protein
MLSFKEHDRSINKCYNFEKFTVAISVKSEPALQKTLASEWRLPNQGLTEHCAGFWLAVGSDSSIGKHLFSTFLLSATA